ncbi:MAG: EAL domain-containing protein, partial [Eubacteriales bacterium]|nr:EAL domain-containing protein [Eubacteriales bacterium]
MRKRVIVLVTFLVLTTVFSCIGRNICHAREQERRANAHEFAAGELRKIAYAIESRITTAKALERYVQSRDGVIDDFAEVAQFYFVDDPALRSIQLAPGGIVTQDLMYPQEDGLLRHDLFADPIRKHEAEQARDTGKVVLAGPYALYQGGQGLIVRDSVYLTDENGESYFWGFSTVIFNVPEVFDLEKMNLLSGDDYVHRLWRYGWLDGETIVMVESTADPLPDAIREQVEICDELWYLDIEPADGWLPLGLVLRVALTGAAALVLIMVGLVLHLRARDMMYYDRLLDIGNMNALAAAYRHAPPETLDRMFAVVLDIDRFKEFNYIYGTDEGNHLLRYIADALQEEAPNASVFRYAFDYFILMEVFDDLESCERRVQQILSRFKRDIIAGTVPTFEISAGIRKVAADEPLQVVIDDALIARESVKGNVLQHYAVYNEVTRSDRLTNMALRSDLPGAIENKEIKIYYQPKYNMITGEIIGCEALSRWVRPDGTMIGPNVFIPCFEESHQITLLDEYVLT